MPIRWSALKVSEAAEKVEEFLNQAVEPLEQAMTVAREAHNITNLPQYIDQDFSRIISEIADCIGGTSYRPKGWFKTVIESVRKDIPDGAIEAERESAKHGKTNSLI